MEGVMSYQDTKDIPNYFIEFPVQAVLMVTDKAWLVVINRREEWVPKSLCHMDQQNESVRVPIWLAEKKEMKFSLK
jgi:hypothetical protein